LSHKFKSFLIFIIFFLFFPFNAKGAEWSLTPGIDVYSIYNSNILFTSKDKKEDYQLFLDPKFSVSGDYEVTKLKGDFLFNIKKYFKHSEFDVVNFNNGITINHWFSPKFSLSLSGNFKKDDILRTELERAGIVGVRKKRYIYGFDIYGSYAFSDRFNVGISGGESFKNYPEGPYPDFGQWYLGINPSYNLTVKDNIGLAFNYYDTDFEDTGRIKLTTGYIYWKRDINENTNFTLGFGGRYTKTEYIRTTLKIYVNPQFPYILYLVPIREKITEEKTGLIFNFSINHNWTEKFLSSVDIIKEYYTTVDARGIDHTYLRTRSGYKLTQKLAIGVNLSYDRNDYESQKYLPKEKVDYVRINPYTTYKISKNLSISGNFSYEYSKDKIETREYIKNRVKFFILLRYNYNKLFSTY